MKARPASWYSGIRALVSPEKAGPTVPTMLWSWMNCGAIVCAWAGSPPVSNSLRTMVVPSFLAFSSLTATLMPSRMLIPRLALSPVLAPTKPMVTVFPLPLLELLLSLPPHAAAIMAIAATTTTNHPTLPFTRRFIPTIPLFLRPPCGRNYGTKGRGETYPLRWADDLPAIPTAVPVAVQLPRRRREHRPGGGHRPPARRLAVPRGRRAPRAAHRAGDRDPLPRRLPLRPPGDRRRHGRRHLLRRGGDRRLPDREPRRRRAPLTRRRDPGGAGHTGAHARVDLHRRAGAPRRRALGRADR